MKVTQEQNISNKHQEQIFVVFSDSYIMVFALELSDKR